MEKTFDPKISIIVPVYNVQKYVEKCLTSIKNQSFTDWECVVVDDGSTDKSGDICDYFQDIDSRFKVIHKENGGQSTARNTALKIAKGEFITFIDSDDYVEPFHLMELYTTIKNSNADVAQTNFIKVFKTFHRHKKLSDDYKEISGIELSVELLYDSRLPSFLWNKIFKREVITSFFPEGKIYEDYRAITFWSEKIKKVAFSPKFTYNYRMRKSSSISQTNAKNLMDFLDNMIHRYEMVYKRFPENFDTANRHIYLTKRYVRIAKMISRAGNNISQKEHLVEYISKSLSKLPDPGKERLGNKTWKRSLLLKYQPEKFIKKMQSLQNYDLYTRFCNAMMYE